MTRCRASAGCHILGSKKNTSPLAAWRTDRAPGGPSAHVGAYDSAQPDSVYRVSPFVDMGPYTDSDISAIPCGKSCAGNHLSNCGDIALPFMDISLHPLVLLHLLQYHFFCPGFDHMCRRRTFSPCSIHPVLARPPFRKR
jgi:hypothetical protein